MKKLLLAILGFSMLLTTSCTSNKELKAFIKDKSGEEVALSLVDKYQNEEVSIDLNKSLQFNGDLAFTLTSGSNLESLTGSFNLALEQKRGLYVVANFESRTNDVVNKYNLNMEYEVLTNLVYLYVKENNTTLYKKCTDASLNETIPSNQLDDIFSQFDVDYNALETFIKDNGSSFNASVTGEVLYLTYNANETVLLNVNEEVKAILDQTSIFSNTAFNVVVGFNHDYLLSSLEIKYESDVFTNGIDMKLKINTKFNLAISDKQYEGIVDKDTYPKA